jgi:hypothetical protein
MMGLTPRRRQGRTVVNFAGATRPDASTGTWVRQGTSPDEPMGRPVQQRTIRPGNGYLLAVDVVEEFAFDVLVVELSREIGRTGLAVGIAHTA